MFICDKHLRTLNVHFLLQFDLLQALKAGKQTRFCKWIHSLFVKCKHGSFTQNKSSRVYFVFAHAIIIITIILIIIIIPLTTQKSLKHMSGKVINTNDSDCTRWGWKTGMAVNPGGAVLTQTPQRATAASLRLSLNLSDCFFGFSVSVQTDRICNTFWNITAGKKT